MEETTFNMESYIVDIDAVAEGLVFFRIPEFSRLRRERLQAEMKFWTEQQARLGKAEKLLIDMSTVATRVFGTKFPVKQVSSEKPEESLNDLCNLVTKAYMQTLRMPIFQKVARTKKFRKEMEKQFGITTAEKDHYEVFRSLLARFSHRYRQIFKGIWDEYYEEVTRRRKAEMESEQDVIEALKRISTRDLEPMWQAGNEGEVVKNCVQIMVEYQAYVQKVPKENITELKCTFQYYNEDERRWADVDRWTIIVADFSPVMGQHQSFKMIG